jgi:hypothetical protein
LHSVAAGRDGRVHCGHPAKESPIEPLQKRILQFSLPGFVASFSL